MVVSTKIDDESGFSIRLDDKVHFKVLSLPETFAFQPSDSVTYFISKEPRDFLNRSKYILTDAKRTQVARITGEFFGGIIFGSKLFVGEKEYRVRLKANAFFHIGIKTEGYRIEELGIIMDSYRRNDGIMSALLSDANEVRTAIEEADEQQLAIIALLHFAYLWKWKEQS
jgi:hypothetical protein